MVSLAHSNSYYLMLASIQHNVILNCKVSSWPCLSSKGTFKLFIFSSFFDLLVPTLLRKSVEPFFFQSGEWDFIVDTTYEQAL